MEAIRPADAGTLLLRALRGAAQAAGCPVTVDRLADRPWRSSTFAGTRHRVDGHAPASPALAAWLAALPEAELPMRGHIVADLAVDAQAADGALTRWSLAVLTIEAD